MTLTKPRDRVVVFRLTEEEYTDLLQACARRSGRSLSEFVRSEVMALLRQTNDSPTLADGGLAQRVQALEMEAAALANRIEGLEIKVI